MNGPHDSAADQAAVPAGDVSSATHSGRRASPPETPAGELPGVSPRESVDVDGVTEADTTGADVFLGMSSGDRNFALTSVVLGCLLLLVHWARQEGAGLDAVEIERLDASAYNYRVDINSATWVELMLLDGIGEQLARRIVADRAQQGPFQSVDDLERVRGIGPKTLARIRPALECRPSVPLESMESP